MSGVVGFVFIITMIGSLAGVFDQIAQQVARKFRRNQ